MPFAEFLNYAIAQTGVTNYKLAKEIGVSQTSVANWRDGITEPRKKPRAAALAFFGVSESDISGTEFPNVKIAAETEKAPTQGGERQISDDDMMFALWGDTEEMDHADLDDVKRYADYVRERKRKK